MHLMRLPVIWVLVAYCGFYPKIHSLRIIARTCLHLLKERQSLMHLLLSGFPSAMLSFPKESPFSCSCGALRKSMFPPRCTSWNPRSAPAVCSQDPAPLSTPCLYLAHTTAAGVLFCSFFSAGRWCAWRNKVVEGMDSISHSLSSPGRSA